MSHRGIISRVVPLIVVGMIGLVMTSPARAIDHDNIDSGRPLTFDDAESIAFRERAFEFGMGLGIPYRRGGVGAGFALEYLYGYRVNTHVSLDIDPSAGARAGSSDKRFDFGSVGVGIFHNLNRETLTTPAYAIRADAYLPTGRGARGVGTRLRGIMSRTFNQYSRLHVNMDANITTHADRGDRAVIPAVTLGVTRPLGYPTRFNRTGLAEIGARASQESGQGTIFYTGVGMRQQVTVRSALDLGVQSDWVATKGGASRDLLRLIAGYSTQF